MHELKTYSVQISEYIKKELLENRLRPGDKINEVRLAEALSISRAPIREALQMLVKDELVVSIPQRGKFIKIFTKREIYDHYSMGGVLEGAAVASCVDLFVDADFTRLEKVHQDMVKLDENAPGYTRDLAGLDEALHDTLVAKAPNRFMAENARAVCQRLSKFLLFRHWPRAFSHAEVVVRHRAVLDAVKSKSPRAIEETLRSHYNELGERMAPFGIDEPKVSRRSAF